jgi:MOSC domain-containing protein YiiM
MKHGKVVSLNISRKKGEIKKPVPSISVKIDWGIEGDAHGGPWHRQISLLAIESFDRLRAKAPEINLDLPPGVFAENITTEGIELMHLPVGTRFKMGASATFEVTQIGKECHHGCAIRAQVGDCVMPREGIFCKVLEEGDVFPGDCIQVLSEEA